MIIFFDVLLWLAVTIVVIFTITPFSHISDGAILGAYFPRQQVLVLPIALIAIAWAFEFPGWRWVFAPMILCALAQLLYIARYLPVWHTLSLEPLDGDDVSPELTVSIVSANVKMSNREFQKLMDLVRDVKADILMALKAGPMMQPTLKLKWSKT